MRSCDTSMRKRERASNIEQRSSFIVIVAHKPSNDFWLISSLSLALLCCCVQVQIFHWFRYDSVMVLRCLVRPNSIHTMLTLTLESNLWKPELAAGLSYRAATKFSRTAQKKNLFRVIKSKIIVVIVRVSLSDDYSMDHTIRPGIGSRHATLDIN